MCVQLCGPKLHILIWHLCIHLVAMEVWHCSSSGDKREFLDEICARHMIYARACQDSWHGVMLERKSNPRPLWCCWHMSHLIRHIQWNLCNIFSCAIVWITSICCVLCLCCVLRFQVVEACILSTGCPHSSKLLILCFLFWNSFVFCEPVSTLNAAVTTTFCVSCFVRAATH